MRIDHELAELEHRTGLIFIGRWFGDVPILARREQLPSGTRAELLDAAMRRARALRRNARRRAAKQQAAAD